MPAVSGKRLRLYVAHPNSPATFFAVGGARTNGFKGPGGNVVDVSDKDSNGWTESGYLGLKSIEVTQAGIWKGTPGEEIINDHLNDTTEEKDPMPLKVVIPGIGTWTFLGTVERDMNGPHDNAAEASYTVKNSGEAIFTPVGT